MPEPRYAIVEEPLHYDGHPVYCDAWGFPFFYDDGHIRYVPSNDTQYPTLIAHFRRQTPLARRWVYLGDSR